MAYAALLLLVLMSALVYALYQFARTRERSRAAVQATVYIVAYPLVVLVAWLAWPLPAWITAPLALAGLPWIVSGIYLNEIVKDPTVARDDQFVGFPYGFWIWGGAVAVLVGYLID
jgi:hypothetical protein